jgi:hypothetical protein
MPFAARFWSMSTLTPQSAATILLLRSLADRIENGELGVSALSNAALIETFTSSDPYSTIPMRTKLEVTTYKIPPTTNIK